MALTIPAETESLLRAEEARTGVPAVELLSQAVKAKFATAPNPPSDEELLRRATQKLSESFWERYRALVAKQKSEIITELERGELIAVVRQANEWHNERLEAAIALAKWRGIPFAQLKQELDLAPIVVE
ncbi:hypothetical protein [Armatimonas sp.]|uniref:hypothetical protein n=1 Tax=Armatimonas sp. TaxID=1872638 RepID=UPI00286AB1C9|nr:hypothetical protein [Armatimonas sp.]